MIWGTTFSHRQVSKFGLSQDEALDTLLKMKFDVVRLCLYWNEVQDFPGVLDYSVIESILSKLEKAGQDVVMTVGMKSPRYPEFYLPVLDVPKKISREVKLATLDFVAKSIEELKSFGNIAYWQVENEALDVDYTTGLSIPEDFLADEVELVRSIDERPIILNAWGNDLSERVTLPKLDKVSDICGLDMYYDQYMGEEGIYLGPRQEEDETILMMMACSNPVWITELQAEPWEKDESCKFNFENPSFNLEKLKRNIEYALRLKPEAILLWGFEYWYFQDKAMGNDQYLNYVSSIIKKLSSHEPSGSMVRGLLK